MPAQHDSTHEPLSFPAAQAELHATIHALNGVTQRLTALRHRLPPPSVRFDPRAELHGIATVVDQDLLQDAIATLRLAATRTPAELERASEERQRLLTLSGAA